MVKYCQTILNAPGARDERCGRILLVAVSAEELMGCYQPAFGSYRECFDYVDKRNLDCEAVSYEPDGKVVLSFGEV